MIPCSTNHAVCKHIDGRHWLVVFAGNAKNARRMCKTLKRNNPGCKYCVSFTIDHKPGDYISFGVADYVESA